MLETVACLDYHAKFWLVKTFSAITSWKIIIETSSLKRGEPQYVKITMVIIITEMLGLDVCGYIFMKNHRRDTWKNFKPDMLIKTINA